MACDLAGVKLRALERRGRCLATALQSEHAAVAHERNGASPCLQEISQLYKIFQIMGTPSEETWPGVSALPDFGPHFPKWAQQDLHKVLRHRMDPEGLDLLHRMLRYAPEERISAVDALAHPYFADLRDYRPGTRLPIA